MCVLKSIPRRLDQFPLWPLLTGIVGGICFADAFGLEKWALCLLSGLLLSIIFRRTCLWMLWTGFMLGHITHGLTIEKQYEVLQPLSNSSVIHQATLKGVVIDTGKQPFGPYLIKVLKSDSLPTGSRVLLPQPKKRTNVLYYGDIVEGTGQLEHIGATRNPHGFDRAKWLHRQGTNLMFTPYRTLKKTGTSWARIPMRKMAQWRQKIRCNITTGIPSESKEAQLIRAVVLGERPPCTSEMIHDFRESGTLHVFAVSGLHVGMVGAIIAAALWFLRVPRWMMVIGVILGMTIYAGITGLRPPSVRAVVMATVFLSGFLIQRKPSLINSLAVSAIIVLLVDGHQLFTPGFQLSYGVLLAIALATSLWTRVLQPIAEIDPFLPRALLTSRQELILEKRKWFRGSLAVSMAAWMGSAPLMWLHFGIVTPIAIIAGIPLMLIVFCILALAMFSLGLGSLCQPASTMINGLNSKCATATYSMASAFAHIPGGHYYRQPHNDGKKRVIVFDLPYGGGAQLLDIGGGILLDCGRNDTFRRHVMPTLTALRIQPDSLIVSHADSRHSGAMIHCLDYYNIKQTMVPRLDLRSPSYKQFLTQAREKNRNLIVPRTGQVFTIEPDVLLEILHAPAELDGYGRADDTGLVLRLHCHGWRILFTGDAGYETESRLLDSGMNLQADVIVMGRNRNDFTGGLAFYQAVRPKAVISSNADFPHHETIPDHWRHAIQSIGAHIFDQQQTGAVTITMDSDALILTPTLKTTQTLTLTHK